PPNNQAPETRAQQPGKTGRESRPVAPPMTNDQAEYPAARAIAFRQTLSWVWTVFGPFLGLVLITALFAALTRESGSFLSIYNWRTIAVQTVIVATAALGMTMIMI